jgi:hypothetical protein
VTEDCLEVKLVSRLISNLRNESEKTMRTTTITTTPVTKSTSRKSNGQIAAKAPKAPSVPKIMAPTITPGIKQTVTVPDLRINPATNKLELRLPQYPGKDPVGFLRFKGCKWSLDMECWTGEPSQREVMQEVVSYYNAKVETITADNARRAEYAEKNGGRRGRR